MGVLLSLDNTTEKKWSRNEYKSKSFFCKKRKKCLALTQSKWLLLFVSIMIPTENGAEGKGN